MLLKPTLLPAPPELEASAHRAPDTLQRELRRVFPSPAVDLDRLLVVPTFQPARCDLVGLGPAQDEEKDRLLEEFMRWAEQVHARLHAQGHWCDYTDPTSGYPMHSERGASPYPDVQGTLHLLKYEHVNTGMCSLVSHPRWRTRCYPATLFTTAPLEALCAAMGVPAPGVDHG